MSGSLLPKIAAGPYRVSPVALVMDDGLPYEGWAEIGRALGELANASAWWIGDWVFHGHWQYGRRYEEALALTGLDYGTLRNYSYVCGRVAASSRNSKLSFSHHAVVAPLGKDEQQHWLTRADSEGWTVSRLRDELKADQAPAVEPGPSAEQEPQPALPAAGVLELRPGGLLDERLLQIEDELRRLAETATRDPEAAHSRADELLLEALTLLGAGDIVAAWQAITKWCA